MSNLLFPFLITATIITGLFYYLTSWPPLFFIMLALWFYSIIEAVFLGYREICPPKNDYQDDFFV